MPLRASKMNGFIFGFQRFVWCPKWTPESNNSFTPMLITIFLWLNRAKSFVFARHPAEHGIIYLMLLWPLRAHSSTESKAVCPRAKRREERQQYPKNGRW